ncbi:dihydrolipoamide acetyltransferase family protein [Deinococcus sp.]|uniref:dihydrolipoamide acetyltransferase family protein n=1 Tax=Deinococcus sp. TaxID=47478 RepID=UPI0025C1EFC5|nr:dihydrolipoamide acetyltransferase family protein [Deinococcus sp.]
MKEIVLPELAESVVEGEILKWLVNEGDPVALEQPLCEVMTDKVTVELPSPVAGVLRKRLVAEGDVVPVHSVIALIGEATGDLEAATAPEPSTEAAPAASRPQLSVQAQEEREQVGGSIVEANHLPAAQDDATRLLKTFAAGQPQTPAPQYLPGEGRTLAVPAARQLARELGLELATVRGSGPNGRIRVQDVAEHAQQGTGKPTGEASGPSHQTPLPAQPQAAKAAAPVGHLPAPVQYRTPKGYEHLEDRLPLRGMRRAISNQMFASHLYTVRTLTVDEVNMTRLVEFRNRVKAEASAANVKLSYLPFIFKAVAAALKKYPSLNTSFDEATQEIVQKRYYNMGMAVATEAGLTVPVIRDVNHKSIFELAREVVDLAGRANDGKLHPDELAGSTFSITNIGTIGALFSFPIINVPDAAILGIHSIIKRPIVDQDDNIVVAHMMYISLSFDHRLVDGADAARFCKEIIRLLENPDRLMLEAL